ncbi:uncharacterized protein TRIVIDRAFT_198657 [Trichoderma virens Gv29-8]|uniref:BZIP domain-containing protein n=1 Tax=Hypocrea virens (strain Gv29-8 / FGSC 10586) TaxID=413071 RepID=G9MJQ0_HYPVG|nr:uncharacterized protein TRIVIDRAFT_198657 [Trichoderma virens Gv29-8]EHK25713.1 hypothetical protein TRIVIDRAFT_198657 [Trichoderma virens Gv29-8]UKZ48470.1 hypothetical protein TrVGV298_002695 [Trichoderma virens]
MSSTKAEKPRRSTRRPGPKAQNDSPENDESLEKRRQRNRKAQRLFRLRRQAAHANYEKNLIHMEGALEQMASTFLDFTNGILQSPLISRDPALISKLRTATDSILFLCQGTNNELEDNSDNSQTTIKAADPSSSTDEAAFQQDFNGNGQLPQTTVLDNMFLDFNTFNQPPPIQQPSSNASTVRNNQLAGLRSPQIRNIFGNGFMNMPPIDFADCAQTDTMLKMYPADDSLSMIVTRASLQHAYDAILSDTMATTPTVDRIFGFPLKFRSREEILMVLRWYLRPQSPEVVRLATAEFDDYLVAQYYHGIVTSQYRAVEGVFRGDIVAPPEKGSPPPPQSRILNAYQIEQWLLACGLKYIDVDTIELTDLKPTGLMLSTKPPDDPDVLLATLRTLQQQESILDGQMANGYNDASESFSKNIRLSRTRLIHVLTGISFCIDKGPAYCEQALLEAVVTAMISDS